MCWLSLRCPVWLGLFLISVSIWASTTIGLSNQKCPFMNSLLSYGTIPINSIYLFCCLYIVFLFRFHFKYKNTICNIHTNRRERPVDLSSIFAICETKSHVQTAPIKKKKIFKNAIGFIPMQYKWYFSNICKSRNWKMI